MSEVAEQRIAELERELRGTQEMMAFVLLTVGSPVMVTKKTLTEGLPNGAEIRIDDDQMTDSFIFSLEVPLDD